MPDQEVREAVRALEARLAVQEVLVRYAAAVDERDLAAYRACFADDVEIIGFGAETVRGADIWVQEVEQKLQAFGATQHLLGPPLITIDDKTASSRIDVQATHYLKDSQEKVLTLWATYLTNYAWIDGAWKITRHQLVPRGTQTSSPS